MGIKSQLGGNVKVAFTRGYYVTPKEETQTNWQENSTKEDQGQNAIAQARQKASDEIREKQDQLRREAVNMAASYQTVLLFVGLNHEYDVEGFDRDTMKLPYRQDQLIQEVLAANPDTIVIMTAGNAVEMGTWKDRARAIVWNWYSGMEGGNALTDVLFGKINPSGKLPESIPFRMEDCGALALGEYPGRELTAQEKTRMNAHTTQTYRDGIYVGYRYYEKYQVPVQFCFGHGLSYTSFQYTEASVQTAETTDESLEAVIARVSVKVRNTGERAGKEIIQVYVGKKDSTIDRAVKELRGFTKITLAPGEEKKTEMELTRRAFTYYSTEKHAFVTEPGQYEIYIGKSLQDIVQVLSFTVKA
jgi:beta-glucosidase